MKWVLMTVLALAALAGAGVWVWGHRGKPGHEIMFAWGPRLSGSWPDCSSTVRQECLTGFTLIDETDQYVISDKIPTSAQTYIYHPDVAIPPGYRHVFTLRVDAHGSDGAPIQSQPATVVVANPAWRFGHPETGMAVVR